MLCLSDEVLIKLKRELGEELGWKLERVILGPEDEERLVCQMDRQILLLLELLTEPKTSTNIC